MFVEPVSIVIPTFNRSRSLRRCIKSIAGQEYAGTYDVLVVDDGSPDDTINTVKSLISEVPYRLSVKTHSNQGPAATRNLGIESTAGQVIVFLDDDHQVQPGWLTALCEPLSDATVGIVNGKNDSVPDGGIVARYVCLRDEREAEKVAEDKERYLTSGNASIRRDTLLKTGGFSQDFKAVFQGVAPGGEDTELGLRIRDHGFKIVYRPDALTNHFREMNFSKLLKERFNFGRNRVKWYRMEGRPMSYQSIIRRVLRVVLSMILIPKNAFLFRLKGYSLDDSIAFAFLDKVSIAAYELGTLYGLLTEPA